jgi:hypothetical protein
VAQFSVGRNNQGIDLDGFEILADEDQASVGTEVVGQFFDNKVGHGKSHLQGEGHFRTKSLIYNGNPDFFTM